MAKVLDFKSKKLVETKREEKVEKDSVETTDNTTDLDSMEIPYPFVNFLIGHYFIINIIFEHRGKLYATFRGRLGPDFITELDEVKKVMSQDNEPKVEDLVTFGIANNVYVPVSVNRVDAFSFKKI